MKGVDVISEMASSDKSRVAVLKREHGLKPIYVTIVRIEGEKDQLLQMRDGATYNWIGGDELLSDKWEWA